VNREVHAPFWERLEVQFLRPTQHRLHWCPDVRACKRCRVAMVNPAEVRSGPVSAHTSTRNAGTSGAPRVSPNTMHGTDRWNGLMPSKATTAIVIGEAGTDGLDMARLYRCLTFGPLPARTGAEDNAFHRTHGALHAARIRFTQPRRKT
jgi:hypothetical protein